MKKYLFAALFALVTVPVLGQTSLKLDIRDGRVDLDAASVPAREILAEWARIGGTKVVGADKITGAPLTLKLESMPEQQALDIILRNVAGYMAAPRRASAEPGASGYDRIVILPTTTAPANANAGTRMPNNTGAMAGLERRVAPRPPGMPEADADVQMEQEPVADGGEFVNPNQPPVFTFPQPQGAAPPNAVFQPMQPGAFGVPGQPGAQPQITLQPGADGQPAIYNFLPQGTGQPATGGFTVIGSPTPGMVQQPPPMPGQPVPGQPRPPGGNE
jgi:hypothetical protein